MTPQQYFPAILILLDVGAAVVYGCCGDVRMTIYWGAAACLTASITF